MWMEVTRVGAGIGHVFICTATTEQLSCAQRGALKNQTVVMVYNYITEKFGCWHGPEIIVPHTAHSTRAL